MWAAFAQSLKANLGCRRGADAVGADEDVEIRESKVTALADGLVALRGPRYPDRGVFDDELELNQI